MNETKNEQFDLKLLVEKIVTTPTPNSCEEIAKLLSNLPVKSWVHRQLPTKEQDQAFEMMKEKSLSPTPEEIKYILDNFDQFKNLCYKSIDNRQRKDNLAPYKNTDPSTSRDPDSEEWRKG